MRIANKGRIALTGILLVALCSCGGEVSETEEYQQGYNDGLEEAQSKYADMAETAQAAIDDARSAVAETKAAATMTASEADRFNFEDWSYVVGDVQAAASRTMSSADQIDSHLDDAESSLSDY